MITRVIDKNGSTAFYRGPEPGSFGATALIGGMGVRTIQNLEEKNADEAGWAQASRLRYVANAEGVFFHPSDASVVKSLTILSDASFFPVFMHCKYGRDRTGWNTAVWRVIRDGWTPEQAKAEAYRMGFHPIYFYWWPDFEPQIDRVRRILG